MQQILHQLRTGGDDSFEAIVKVVPWLEAIPAGETIAESLARYDSIPDPRLFKTHCTHAQTPGTNVARIILTSRDPRDCCVSFYHHTMGMTDETRVELSFIKPQSFDEYFEHWMKMGSWFRNIVSWWPHRNDPNVLFLRVSD